MREEIIQREIDRLAALPAYNKERAEKFVRGLVDAIDNKEYEPLRRTLQFDFNLYQRAMFTELTGVNLGKLQKEARAALQEFTGFTPVVIPKPPKEINGIRGAVTGADAYETARKKARYGHKDWIVWTEKTGTRFAAPKSRESIKAALLAVGTQGRFSLIGASNAVSFVVCWSLGTQMMRNVKYDH